MHPKLQITVHPYLPKTVHCYLPTTDGWQSSATGSGACSHHGGVDHWLYEDDKE
jgi:hypothetical protein